MSVRNPIWRIRARVRPFLVALAAGGMYGSWAAFVHIHSGLGTGVALCAGWTQVALSVFTTLVFALLLERLFRWPPNPLHGFWLAATASSVLGAVWLIVGHEIAGTPHILEAIAPALIIGTAFDFTYAGRLLALAKRNAVTERRTAASPRRRERSASRLDVGREVGHAPASWCEDQNSSSRLGAA
jgi:hypothetical protein